MVNGAVGMEASQQTGSETYFLTYQKLLKQKKKIDREAEKIDRQLLKLQGKFFKAVSRHGKLPMMRAKYVPRLDNKKILATAIRECMKPQQEMNMGDVLKSLGKKNLYNTDSKYFYTMVNNKLNRDPHIKKVSRGVFVYKPRTTRRRKAAVA
jgi:uncharacterized transporter YbjL